MRARIEPMAGGEDLDIPMPVMTPAYRVAGRKPATMDPATRRLAIFSGAIGGALVLLVGVWSFTGHHHAGVPVIEADSRPLRVKPANPGGLQVADANESILSGEADGKEAMAPPPESPEPQVLKAETEAAAASAPAPAAAPPQPLTLPEPAKPAASTAAPRLAAAPEAPPPPASKPATTVASARPVPAPSQLGMAARPAAAASGPVVQLAALDSEAAAKAEWQRLAHRYGELLSGHTPSFSRTEHAGKSFWRVRTSGFSDMTDAVLFCERVKAKGGGCTVASF